MNILKRISLLLSFVVMTSLMSATPSTAAAGLSISSGPGTINATVGSAITPVTFTASGGTAPYSITISPSMINGFSASTTADSLTINGTAAAAQTDPTYTITVTDSASGTASTTVTISATAPAGLSISSGPGTINATVGSAITPVTFTASGGTAPYSITISPSMINGFSASTTADSLTINGTAAAAQTDPTYTITVTDSASGTASTTVTISATAPAGLSISSGPGTINATVGSAITPVTFTASGGTAPYSITISPSMINGFSASTTADSLTINGTAAAAQTDPTYTITVTDSASGTASTTVTISATAPAGLSISSGPGTINATVGSAITPVTFTASGGTAPYSITISPSMINGFSASTTADSLTINGTAAAAQTDPTYTITVTDSASGTASTTVTISATAPAGLSISSGPGTINATVGSAITPVTFTASGGTAPYSITISPSMINGFSASTTADSLTINGTAAAAQTDPTYTITVTDSASGTASTTVTISATAPAGLSISSGPGTINATVGSAITPVTFTASGGTAPYSITISPSMINGFSASTTADSLTINGTAAAAQTDPTYTITVTDSASGTASTTVTIRVSLPPLNIVGPSLIDAVVGFGQFVVYSASGAVGEVVFSLSSTIDGVSLSSSSGALTVSSNMSPGSYTIYISAIDSRGVSGSISVLLNVKSNSSGTGNQNGSNELSVIAPSLQIIEGQPLPLLTPTYSNRNSVSTLAICEIFTPEKKIAEEIYAGQYEILCRGVTTNDGSKVIYISGVLKVAIKPQDSAETKLDALIERPRVIYVSPNVEVNSKISLQNSRGNTIISVHFDEKTVLVPTSFYFTPWPINTVDKATPVLNISAKDNKGTAINSLEKPMSLKFPKVPANSIPAFSTDGNDWINFPQITKSDLAEGILEGFYTDANGEITIFTEELGLIGFRLAQKSFALSVRNKKSLYGLTEAVQVKTPRLLGTGEISYQSLLPRACSISNDGIVKTITGGECLVIAKKASDSKYSTTTSEVLTLKFTVPPTPKPTPKPSVKPTKSPSTKPTTGPTPPVTAPKAPKGYAIIPGIDGVFTPTKDGGTKNNAVLKLGAQISGEFNQQLNSQFSVSLSGLDKGAVISPILVTPEGLSAILQSGKYDSTKQYVSQSLKFTKTGTYKIIFRIAGTNTARVISINIK